mmetsp:Transcript_60989/g.164480  ORF Transcript_60989/g.164480 Transcript_60989/m.164480 type:complete len:226 (+) Transcript_60989:440-1117(+)
MDEHAAEVPVGPRHEQGHGHGRHQQEGEDDDEPRQEAGGDAPAHLAQTPRQGPQVEHRARHHGTVAEGPGHDDPAAARELLGVAGHVGGGLHHGDPEAGGDGEDRGREQHSLQLAEGVRTTGQALEKQPQPNGHHEEPEAERESQGAWDEGAHVHAASEEPEDANAGGGDAAELVTGAPRCLLGLLWRGGWRRCLRGRAVEDCLSVHPAVWDSHPYRRRHEPQGR